MRQKEERKVRNMSNTREIPYKLSTIMNSQAVGLGVPEGGEVD